MINLSFVGDISFNDAGKNQELDYSEFLEINSSSDFTVANLEALVSKGEVNLLKNPRVTTSEKALNKLEKLNISMVTLAHNHVYDAKGSGFKATLKKLKILNIPFIGAGLSKIEAEEPYVLKKNGLKIGFLNYCTDDTNPSLPNNCEVFVNKYDSEKIIVDIEKLKKKCNHVVLLLHWGGTFEGGYFPDECQVKDAEKFAKAGVCAIIGHHPHTLQPGTTIGATPVHFSLGNFIFYDIKHQDKIIKLSSRRKKGGVLNLKFSETQLLNEQLFFSTFQNGKISVTTNNLIYSIRVFFFNKFGNTSTFKNCYRVQFKYLNPLFYFVFVQEGGIKKIKNLNLSKFKRYLWKK